MNKNKVNEIIERNLYLSKEAHITEKNRLLNTLVLGKKYSGKTNNLLMLFAKQDLEDKNCGLTFVVSKKDMAYTLYAMAKEAGRKESEIIILKPSANFKVMDELIWEDSYSYDTVSEFINYKEAIKKKKVVIIDMEYSQYRNYAIRTTAMLLIQLQQDMQDVKKTLKRTHFVYIDDAPSYIPYIELLLTTGEMYNIGTHLFMQSREELKTKNSFELQHSNSQDNYLGLVDNNVRNIILTTGLNYEDAEFYRRQFIISRTFYTDDKEWKENLDRFVRLNPNVVDVKNYKDSWKVFYYNSIQDMLSRRAGNILFETLDSRYTRITASCQILAPTDDYTEKVQKRAIQIRKKLSKKVTHDVFYHKISLQEKKEMDKLNDDERKGNSISAMLDDIDKQEKINEKSSIKRIFETQTPKEKPKEVVEKPVIIKEEADIKTKPKEKIKKPIKKDLSKVVIPYIPLNETIAKQPKEENVDNHEEERLQEIESDDILDSIVLDSAFDKKPKTDSIASEIDDKINDDILDIESDIESDVEIPGMDDIENALMEDMETMELEEYPDMEEEPSKSSEQIIENEVIEDIDFDNMSDSLMSQLMGNDFSEDLMDLDLDIDDDMDISALTNDISNTTKHKPKSVMENISQSLDEFESNFQGPQSDDEDEEIFNLGFIHSDKPRTNRNVDKTGIVSGSRIRKKPAMVFPKTTKRINEQFLNEKLDSL